MLCFVKNIISCQNHFSWNFSPSSPYKPCFLTAGAEILLLLKCCTFKPVWRSKEISYSKRNGGPYLVNSITVFSSYPRGLEIGHPCIDLNCFPSLKLYHFRNSTSISEPWKPWCHCPKPHRKNNIYHTIWKTASCFIIKHNFTSDIL